MTAAAFCGWGVLGCRYVRYSDKGKGNIGVAPDGHVLIVSRKEKTLEEMRNIGTGRRASSRCGGWVGGVVGWYWGWVLGGVL